MAKCMLKRKLTGLGCTGALIAVGWLISNCL